MRSDSPNPYKNWWLRSPYTNLFNVAYLAYPSGVVGFGQGDIVTSSYGRISPSAVTNLDTFITTTTGDVGHAGNTSIYTYSYGNKNS